MSRVFLISDLHLDHKSILTFSPLRGGTNKEEHNEWIIKQWNSVVTKQDMTWVLGDVSFSKEGLKLLKRMNGNKNLVRGNHDVFHTTEYLKYFQNVYGLVKERGYWLSHAPVHPQSLRNKRNIHGHVHQKSIPDDNYINVCVEPLNGVPIEFDEIIARYPRPQKQTQVGI